MNFTPPQLARAFTVEKFHKKKWDGWVMEPKHDGMRAIVHVSEDGVEIWSRSGKPYAQLLPKLVEVFKTLPAGTIIDGELAIIDEWFPLPYIQDSYARTARIPVVNFNKTMRIMGTGEVKAIDRQNSLSENYIGDMSFIAFDLPMLEGRDLSDSEQWARSIGLRTLLEGTPDTIVVNPTLPAEISIYDDLVEAGIEGVILKNQKGIYKEGRNSDWLKLKSEKTFDVVVTGFTDANEGKTGKWLGQIGAIEFSAYMPDGELKYVGRCSGMDDATRKMWTDIRDNEIRIQSPGIQYGGYVIEVKANELVGTGEYRTPRHPQYVTLRTDKVAAECTMDQFE